MNPPIIKHKLTTTTKRTVPILFLLLASIYLILDTFHTTTTTTLKDRHLYTSTSHTFHLPQYPSLSTPPNPPDDTTLIHPTQRQNPDQIRYATLGSSSTWGAGIGAGDLEDRMTFAYPWLLSNRTSNFAIRAGGPNYPATCTSTLLGAGEDDVYDVVVFEYFMRAGDGLATLAKRIRGRFPDAILIFLLNWDPTMITRCMDSICGERQWMFDYVQEKGFDIQNGGMHDAGMQELFHNSTTETFSFSQYAMKHKLDLVLDVAKDVGGYVAPMPAPNNPRDWINYAHTFAKDAHHLSRQGHREVHDRIRAIVNWHGVPLHPRIHPYADFDYCMNWFQTGDMTGIDYSPNGVVEKMPNTNKYTLSFTDGIGWDGEKGDGWIRVENPTDGVLALYLGYMTTGPRPSLYPATQVFIESIDANGNVLVGDGYDGEPPMVLDPNAVDEFGDATVHISRIENVGVVHPGYSFVRFKKLEETERPFRLVSVMITTEEVGSQFNTALPGGNEN